MIEFIRFGFFGIGDVPQISTNPTYPLPPLLSIQPRVSTTVYLSSGLDANDSHLPLIENDSHLVKWL